MSTEELIDAYIGIGIGFALIAYTCLTAVLFHKFSNGSTKGLFLWVAFIVLQFLLAPLVVYVLS